MSSVQKFCEQFRIAPQTSLNQVGAVARSVLGRGLKPLMDEAQVVAGIPTLSADSKAVSRSETVTVTSATTTQPAPKTESRSTMAGATEVKGPSIYRKRAQVLPVGNSVQALPRWPFWVADGVLLAGALAVWLLAPRPMSIGSIILAVVLILIGAGLALVPWLGMPAAKPGTPKAPADNPSSTQPPLQRLPFRLQ